MDSASGNGFVRAICLSSTLTYTGLVVWATHAPPSALPQSLGSASVSDKLLHFMCYAGLAVLATSTAIAWHRATAKNLVFLFVAIGVATAISETVQPLTQRVSDFFDWLADVIGAGAGMVFVACVWQAYAVMAKTNRGSTHPRSRPGQCQDDNGR